VHKLIEEVLTRETAEVEPALVARAEVLIRALGQPSGGLRRPNSPRAFLPTAQVERLRAVVAGLPTSHVREPDNVLLFGSTNQLWTSEFGLRNCQVLR
jgi:hypothetical protein